MVNEGHVVFKASGDPFINHFVVIVGEGIGVVSPHFDCGVVDPPSGGTFAGNNLVDLPSFDTLFTQSFVIEGFGGIGKVRIR